MADVISFKLTGVSPLLVHSERGVNPLDDDTREKKAITKKKKKTEEDLEELYRIEWVLGLYYDKGDGNGNKGIGPYVPGQNVEASIKEAARLEKRGKDVVRGLKVINDKIALIYDGPRDIEKLWKAKKFTDVRSVKQQQSRIMRCRPIFPQWSIVCDVSFDTSVFNRSDVEALLTVAGEYIGLCDYRPRYGRFTSEVNKN